MVDDIHDDTRCKRENHICQVSPNSIPFFTWSILNEAPGYTRLRKPDDIELTLLARQSKQTKIPGTEAGSSSQQSSRRASFSPVCRKAGI